MEGAILSTLFNLEVNMANTGTSASVFAGMQPSERADRMRRYSFEDFKSGGVAHVSGTPFGDPVGTAGNVNYWVTDKNILQYHVLGTQTILAPVRTATGLNISQDLTNNDGTEWTFGCEEPEGTVIGARTRATFTVGTDRPFFTSLKFKLADVSGSDVAIVGFRKSEAYQAAHSSYDELAAIGNISGDIKIYTILNAGTPTTTDTTQNWADAETHTLTVIVDSDGSLNLGAAGGSQVNSLRKVYYEIDGVKPTTTAAFTFDNAEVVIPFFYFIHDSDVAETTELIEWEVGFVGVGNTTQLAAQ